MLRMGKYGRISLAGLQENSTETIAAGIFYHVTLPVSRI
jgi:hypothetical protein